mmetsp:Transcript_5222/g.9070  ORF Transcript_5222/g.9070 Transcript_5222/m.9070 type:complete len:93 (-) Transcript_5222:766-1044(-)
MLFRANTSAPMEYSHTSGDKAKSTPEMADTGPTGASFGITKEQSMAVVLPMKKHVIAPKTAQRALMVCAGPIPLPHALESRITAPDNNVKRG